MFQGQESFPLQVLLGLTTQKNWERTTLGDAEAEDPWPHRCPHAEHLGSLAPLAGVYGDDPAIDMVVSQLWELPTGVSVRIRTCCQEYQGGSCDKERSKKSVGREQSFAFLLPVLQRLWFWLVHGAKARFGSSLYFLAEKE